MRPAQLDRVLIGGQWVAAEHGTYDVIDPATEAVAGAAPECSPGQVAAACRAAREAFERGPWPRMSGAERAAHLERLADAFEQAAPALVELTIAETGALHGVAVAQQIGAVAPRLRRNATLARLDELEGLPPVPLRNGTGIAGGVVVREPVGVVACITPYNFPMTNCAGKVGPALAFGNTCVVKPAPVNPLGVAELCRIAGEILPPGVINFVSGRAVELGEALSTSPDVDMVSFTGSTAVGQRIQEAGARTMKRTLLELGGKSANVVFADCDVDAALRSAMSVWTFHTGQICIAGTRLLIEDALYDELTAKLAAAAARLRIGDPREEGVVVGPLMSAAQRERVEHYIEVGKEDGATLACGGGRPRDLERGYFVEPTLFTDVRNDMRIAREEIFGPVIAAIRFRDEEEAVALANDSDYGLYGYVWSGDTQRAFRVARALRTGTVQINGAPPHPEAPFGGFKMSGVGRDGGRFAREAYTELKYIGFAT